MEHFGKDPWGHDPYLSKSAEEEGEGTDVGADEELQ